MEAPLDALAKANPEASPDLVGFAVEYLSHYGYLAGSITSKANSPQLALVDFSEGVRALQERAGLDTTGELDKPTLELIAKPRCGCLDFLPMRAEEARWRKNRLTYYIDPSVIALAEGQAPALLQKAWDFWAEVGDVQARRVTSPQEADIVISTGQGAKDGFDGPSGVLAWAQLPPGNDSQLIMRFDLGEMWRVTLTAGQFGILLLNVATHEFGHLLGLDHSTVSSALMAPFYAPAVFRPQTRDDIPRIQGLYGPPKAVAGPGPAGPSPSVPSSPANPLGGDLVNLFNALRSLLPFLEMMAKATPSTLDDQLLAILKALAGGNAQTVAAVKEKLENEGAVV